MISSQAWTKSWWKNNKRDENITETSHSFDFVIVVKKRWLSEIFKQFICFEDRKKRAGTFVKKFFDIEVEDVSPSWREKIVWTGISGYWCGLHSDITKIVNVAQIKVVFYDGDTLSNCIISSFFCCKKNSRKRYD